MPVAINILVNLLFGSALVLAVRRTPALFESFVGWPLFALLGYQAVVVTPATTFLVRFYPQWSMLYWFDPQLAPQLDAWMGPLSALAVVLNAAAALAGYALTRTGLLRELAWLWLAPVGLGSFGLAFLLAGFWRRVIFVGDYDGFWQGNTGTIFTSLAGWVGLVTYAGAAALVVWLNQRVRRPVGAGRPQ